MLRSRKRLFYFQLTALDKKSIAVKKLVEKANSSSAVIKALIDKNILEEFFIQQDRVDFSGTSPDLLLSEVQEKMLSNLILFKRSLFITRCNIKW
jgi:primosomal protein N' (replication factor Y)